MRDTAEQQMVVKEMRWVAIKEKAKARTEVKAMTNRLVDADEILAN